jgi:hypothetical protein
VNDSSDLSYYYCVIYLLRTHYIAPIIIIFTQCLLNPDDKNPHFHHRENLKSHLAHSFYVTEDVAYHFVLIVVLTRVYMNYWLPWSFIFYYYYCYYWWWRCFYSFRRPSSTLLLLFYSTHLVSERHLSTSLASQLPLAAVPRTTTHPAPSQRAYTPRTKPPAALTYYYIPAKNSH